MESITLEMYLQEKGTVSKGLICHSALIKKLEIYGFVNARKDKNKYNKSYAHLFFNGLINKDPKGQIIMSSHIFQATTYYEGNEIVKAGNVTPIYPEIRLSETKAEYNIENLRVPFLLSTHLYDKIKSRRGTGVSVTEQEFTKAKWGDNYKLVDGKVMLEAPEYHVQCLNKDGVIKGIGENLMAVCRYLHEETGTMCYTQYNLDEIYLDDVH